MTPARHVCVMGISGSGKSTLGPLLAVRLGLPFKDADDFHPPANIAKQAAGQPLTDEDRRPWLDAIGAHLRAHPEGAIVGCSALRRTYRDRLRGACPDLVFLHLSGDPAVIAERQAARKGHFMPPSLIASQLATLEHPGQDEGVITLDIARPPEALAEEAARRLGA